MAERISLKMDKNLLLSVIKDQAGTFDKAVLELMMNAVEAGSTTVYSNLTVTNGKALFEISDDGKGITSRDEIDRFFATFGTPHIKSENKIWAKFRMGRGQAFSYGKNVWRTSTFKMTVDINSWGLEYELEENLPFVQGCKISIEMYENPLAHWNYSSMDKLTASIHKQVEFMSTPIYFNGNKITTDPKTLKWTCEDEDAYYLFGEGTNLSIYNLGAFVRTRDAYEYGVIGTIVSKKQLEVNFARNDVMSKCPVWQNIQDVVRDNKKSKVRREINRLSDSEKHSLVLDMRDSMQSWADVKNISLIRTAQRRMMSPYNVLNMKTKWSFAQNGDRRADNLMERGQAICFDKSLLTDLHYRGSEKEFFTWLLRGLYTADMNSWNIGNGDKIFARIEKLYAPLDTLTNSMKESYEIIPTDKWTALEKRIIRVLQNFDCWQGRTLMIGASDTATAWTDGSSYIALERVWLSEFRDFGCDYSAYQLFSVMAHELAHDDDTTHTHIHGSEYFECFYRLSMDWHKSPMVHMPDFKRRLERMKIDQIQAKEVEKQRLAVRKRNKKLGLADVAASSM
jgi:hypothetical protein